MNEGFSVSGPATMESCPACEAARFSEGAAIQACPRCGRLLLRASASSIPLLTRYDSPGRPLAMITLPASFQERYALQTIVGLGGSGMVVLAQDRQKMAQVAIKFLAQGGNVSERARFEQESALTLRLRHPNVVPVTEIGEAGNYPYLVMDFMPGGTLHSRLKQTGALSPDLAVKIGVQVLAGLEACHSQGIIHRDLKPANVLFEATSPDAVARIADLGIAKSYGNSAALTATGVLLGTPRYMSPEQCRGEPTGTASDLYSFGIMLYEMLSGAPPFTDENPMHAVIRHLETAPRPLEEVAPQVPRALVAAVHATLEKRASLRPGSAGDLAIRLQKSLAPGSITSTRVTKQRDLDETMVSPTLAAPAPSAVPLGRILALACVCTAVVLLSFFWKTTERVPPVPEPSRVVMIHRPVRPLPILAPSTTPPPPPTRTPAHVPSPEPVQTPELAPTPEAPPSSPPEPTPEESPALAPNGNLASEIKAIPIPPTDGTLDALNPPEHAPPSVLAPVATDVVNLPPPPPPPPPDVTPDLEPSPAASPDPGPSPELSPAPVPSPSPSPSPYTSQIRVVITRNYQSVVEGEAYDENHPDLTLTVEALSPDGSSIIQGTANLRADKVFNATHDGHGFRLNFPREQEQDVTITIRASDPYHHRTAGQVASTQLQRDPSQGSAENCCRVQADIQTRLDMFFAGDYGRNLDHAATVQEIYKYLEAPLPRDPGAAGESTSHFHIINKKVQCSVHGVCQ
jgi:serine/threonine protein kinase